MPALNAGINLATGEILAFLDADCLVTPEWLIRGSAPLSDKEIVGVGGGVEGYAPKNDVQRWMCRKKIFNPYIAFNSRFKPFLQNGNAFFPRDIVNAVGGFSEDLNFGEDADISWKILMKTGKRFVVVSVSYPSWRCEGVILAGAQKCHGWSLIG